MEVGFFLLVIIAVVVGILGGGVYAIAAYLRWQKFSPEGDKLDGPEEEPQEAPGHTRVESDQRARFLGTR